MNTYYKKAKEELNQIFTPRILCTKCAWNNYKYNKDGHELKRCVICGTYFDEKAREEAERAKFRNEILKRMKKLEDM